jgi:hypothetical protein
MGNIKLIKILKNYSLLKKYKFGLKNIIIEKLS